MRRDLLGAVLAAVPAGSIASLLGVVVAAVAAGSIASPLAAQSLAEEIERAPDGWIVFQYALERDVEICANGGMRRGDSWRMRWSDGRGDFCAGGFAQAELRIRDGEVTDVEIQPPSVGRGASSETDLGERDPQEVADYFLTLARESPRRGVAEDAIMPAVVAEDVTVWPQLRDIGLDRGLDDEVREAAVFWLSQVDTERALEALEEILDSSDEPDIRERAIFAVSQHGSSRSTEVLKGYAERDSAPRNLRENAIFWLGQSDGGGEYLQDLYASVDSRELKEKIIFGVSQSGEAEDARWLLDRAQDPSESTKVRKNALFWAGQAGVEVGTLRELYADVSDREMKEQIIFVLSQSSHEGEAAEQLMEIARNEADRDLQKKALFWLGQQDDPRVAEFLLELIRATPVR